jgi:DMSO/TMAO reductase YedYZ molybdopterin-dependent catalytic subunit
VPTREGIFHLIETADNFIKYAPEGREQAAESRARKRYEEACNAAIEAGDEEMARLAGLRLADLDRKSLERYDDPGAGDDAPEVLSEIPEHAQERIPPGQRVTRRWPVLHEGRIPRFDRATWRFEVSGSVVEPIALGYDELRSLPAAELRSDFHCVTGWSKLDNVWSGVQTKDLLRRAKPLDDAAHVSVVGERNYTANVPLTVLVEDDAILAWGHDGRDLAPKHGYPLRLVVPKLYGWKSVKWVRRLEVKDEDERGYWEVRGYHNRADPWREERYSYQEMS